jgi:hypothetical protein
MRGRLASTMKATARRDRASDFSKGPLDAINQRQSCLQTAHKKPRRNATARLLEQKAN